MLFELVKWLDYRWLKLEWSARKNGACESGLVGVLYFVAYRYTACELSDFYIGGCARYQSENVEVGSVGFDCRAGGENYFVDAAFFYALNKRCNLQCVGANAVDGRYEAAKHVIQPSELAGVLDAHHIFYVFYHANHGSVARGRRTDGAQLVLADVVAFEAVANTCAHAYYGIAERLGLVGGAAEKVQGKA